MMETPVTEDEKNTCISIPFNRLSEINGGNVIYQVELSSVSHGSDLEKYCLQFTDREPGENVVVHDNQKQSQNLNQSDHTGKMLEGKYTGTNIGSVSRGKNYRQKRKDGVDLQCDVCGKEYDCLKKLTAHKKYHSAKRPHLCRFCGKAFKMKNDLERHIRIHTNTKPYRCSYCDMRFTQSGTRKIHERLHTGDKRFKCDECGKDFRQKGELRNHKIKHTNDRNIKWEVCWNTFKDKKGLIRHEKLHKSREFQCEFCLREFVVKYDLLRHQRINCKKKTIPNTKKNTASFSDIEKEYQENSSMGNLDIGNENVGQNSQKTTNESNLQGTLTNENNLDIENENLQETTNENNLDTEHAEKENLRETTTESNLGIKTENVGKKSMQCKVCKKQFKFPSRLKCHLKSHMKRTRTFSTRNITWLCEFCGKRLSSKIELEKHVSLHTGVAPYSCSYCNKRFHTAADLDDHGKHFCNELEHRCTVCPRRYYQKHTLKNHMKIHFKEDVLNCELCGNPSLDKREKVMHYGVHINQLFTKSGIKQPENTNIDNYLKILYQKLQEKGTLLKEKENLLLERGSSSHKKITLKQERDTLSLENGTLSSENGSFSQEKETLQQGREISSKEKRTLLQEKKTSSQVKEAISQEKGTLLQEKEILKPEDEKSNENDEDLNEKEEMFRAIVKWLQTDKEAKSVQIEQINDKRSKAEVEHDTIVLRRSSRNRKQTSKISGNLDLSPNIDKPFNKRSETLQDIQKSNSRKRLRIDRNSNTKTICSDIKIEQNSTQGQKYGTPFIPLPKFIKTEPNDGDRCNNHRNNSEEGEKSYCCTKCKRRFYMKCVFKNHEQVCKGHKASTLCKQSKQYLKKQSPQSHPDFLFKCLFCEKRYPQKIFLVLHMKRFHKMKPLSIAPFLMG